MIKSKNYEVTYYHHINADYALKELKCKVCCRVKDLPVKFLHLHNFEKINPLKFITIKEKNNE